MYLPIDQLINKCGRQFIVDLLPKLFININTASAEDKPSLIDSDYNGLNLSFPLLSLADTNTNTNTNTNKLSYLHEHYADIRTIISLFHDCKDELDISSFDYIVFSYLGDFIVRYKNQETAKSHIGKSLYLDIQSVRIALVDEHTERTWNKYYNLFNYTVKYVGGLFVFGFTFNFVRHNFYNMRRMIGL